MKIALKPARALSTLGIALLLSAGAWGIAQVGSAEIANPRLKAAEAAYLSRLIDLNRAIARIKFPYAFTLSRYAGLDPKEQVGADRRGLEFVLFQDRMVLKLTGNYNAAFSSELLTSNQRAGRVFEDVIAPIVRLLPAYFSPQDNFDDFGFEIAYHTRARGKGFEYEGKEMLVVVMERDDALSFAEAREAATRQEILNRAEVYLDGKRFGLALGAAEPFEVEALVRRPDNSLPPAQVASAVKPAEVKNPIERPDPYGQRGLQAPPPPSLPAVRSPEANRPSEPREQGSGARASADAASLQAKYQPQLDELGKDGVAKHHFVDYAPPSFVVFRNRLALQLTLRNPSGYQKASTSIYKRAAQSFDLFFAPQLKPIIDRIPESEEISDLDVTILNEILDESGKSSEALEFVFPMKLLRRFAAAEITNQELINQSVVLVNGVRIALNLQQVE